MSSFFRPFLASAALVLCAAGTVHAGSPAGAGENLSNAAGVCQSALPVYESAFRKRPLAIVNEGAAPAFLTCSLTAPTSFGGNAGTRGVEIAMINTSDSEQTVTCTVVIGTDGSSPKFFPREVTISANSRRSLRVTADTDNDGVLFDTYSPVNASCNVPAGVGLAETYVWWTTAAPAA